MTNLEENEGFTNLDVYNLIRDENSRQTAMGQELSNASKQKITSEQIVRMLRRIIYSGNKLKQKFILHQFPEIIDEANEFEKGCA